MVDTSVDGTTPPQLLFSTVFDAANASVTEKQSPNGIPGGPGSIIHSEGYKIADRFIECGFIPSFGILGLPANIINMVIFYRQGLRDKMNLCLFTLSLTDFFYLLCMFLSTVYCPALFLPDDIMVQVTKWNILISTFNFRYAFMYSSGALTAIIATERCICVVWPLKSASIFTTKTMACLIFGVIIVLNLLCVPYALKSTVRMDTDETGRVTATLIDTDLFLNHLFVFQKIRDTLFPIISFLTFIVVSFVTMVTVRKLRTAMDWRQKTSGHVMDKRQLMLVKMLITISCVYIACSLPNVLLAIVRFITPDFSTVGKYRAMFFITHRAGFGLLMVNSSANFFIYYKQSSRFRKDLQACVCNSAEQMKENLQA